MLVSSCHLGQWRERCGTAECYLLCCGIPWSGVGLSQPFVTVLAPPEPAPPAVSCPGPAFRRGPLGTPVQSLQSSGGAAAPRVLSCPAARSASP